MRHNKVHIIARAWATLPSVSLYRPSWRRALFTRRIHRFVVNELNTMHSNLLSASRGLEVTASTILIRAINHRTRRHSTVAYLTWRTTCSIAYVHVKNQSVNGCIICNYTTTATFTQFKNWNNKQSGYKKKIDFTVLIYDDDWRPAIVNTRVATLRLTWPSESSANVAD